MQNPILFDGKPYIAHSKLIDLEKNKNIPDQKYEIHINGVYNAADESLKRVEKFVSKKVYSVMRRSVLLASIYHDLGKLDDQSQKILYGEISGNMLNHVDAGVAYLLKKYNSNKDTCYLIAAYLVLAHHIGLPNYNRIIKDERQLVDILLTPTKHFRDRKSLKKYSMGRKMVKTHVDKNLKKYIKIHKSVCDLSESMIDCPSKSDALFFLSNPLFLKMAISILVDSDHEETSLNYKEIYPHKIKKLNAKENLKNLLSRVKKVEEEWKNGLVICSEERFRLRQDFFEACGDVDKNYLFYLVDGTVGIGKTLGIMRLSLELAIEHDLETIILVLPYIALIDQSAREYRKFLFKDGDNSDYELSVIHSIFQAKNVFHRKYTKSFSSPINLTTSVNFFQSVFSNQTSIFKSLHKFIGSVIVLDEYPASASYEFWPIMLSFMYSMSKHFSCKFVFASGTPVEFWKIEEIIKKINVDFDSLVKKVIPDDLFGRMMEIENNRVKIISSLDKPISFNELTDEILEQEKSTFLIINTRRKSVKMHQKISMKTNRKVFLRFSGMAPDDRDAQFEEIKRLMDNGENVIVVATQGSDIGLNISFYCGYKESSNYDSVAQMKGRVNRGCEYDSSFLKIFKFCEDPNEDGIKYKNNPSFKHKTNIFESEKDLHKYVSPEYSTSIAKQEVSMMPKGDKEKMDSLIYNWNCKNFQYLGDDSSFITMPSIHILVDLEIFEKMRKGEFVPYNKIQSKIVNLIWNEKEMEKLKDHLVLVDEEMDKYKEEIGEDKESERKTSNQGLYFWKGVYDSKNYGIFADPIFELIDLQTLIA